MTDNYQIADAFSLLSKLMDIHGENSFKSKSYAAAAFAIEKCVVQLHSLPKEKIAAIKGIGASATEKIIELHKTGELPLLNQYIAETPPGVIEMLRIKGLGPKKIHTIWKEMAIESIGELLYACEENRLKMYKGFGEKTQQSVKEQIAFYQTNKELYLFAEIEKHIDDFKEMITAILHTPVSITGEIRRQCEIISSLDFVVSASQEKIKAAFLQEKGILPEEENENYLRYKTDNGLSLKLFPSSEEDFFRKLVLTSSSSLFAESIADKIKNGNSEHAVFASGGLDTVPAPLREHPVWLQRKIPQLIQPNDIRGIIHSHSNWSDGSHSIEEMALACIKKGLEYLVISDHSKSAFYANGLQEERIASQHIYIDELNKKLTPFKIFKSIESDILGDGKLDYEQPVLQQFDLIIASVHSHLKMTEEKAMHRLINAIENPYTTILGHLTGRLLLSRQGYPVNHKKIIDACAANNVAIELNAHPSRLDIDWREIDYALNKGVLLSINPDAHVIEGINDTRYGVLAAQKAGVTKEQNLSSYSLTQFEQYLNMKKNSRAM